MIGKNNAARNDFRKMMNNLITQKEEKSMKQFSLLVLAALLLLSGSLYAQKFEGLALTPPMGWNSWNTFACNVVSVIV
jgi:hypothetical protein